MRVYGSTVCITVLEVLSVSVSIGMCCINVSVILSGPHSTKETVNSLKEATANSNSYQTQKPSTLMVGGCGGGGGGGSSDESQDSSPKTHPKGYKPPSPQGSPKTCACGEWDTTCCSTV